MTHYDLAIAADHAGLLLKNKIAHLLSQQKIRILDLGTNSHERVDYPDFANQMIENIIEQVVTQGILICGTGIGMSIAANRSTDIRAALCFNVRMAELSRLHNNANVLVLGSQIVDDNTAFDMVDKFLSTKFEGGRHLKRITTIS